ncbi:hypothetical protein B0A54_10932 [Friedmanniomyces endolithicus]|uniref:FAD/NAD(P)-binding domain-containing protein n=1 Tax=Friedmanniomyces endolithicus TaxID=329885 RepID=A0A4U0UNR1_9PEZI|nr:hypothetical protein B0A54_10932 [Friedmanniomyces endolithicus]
MQRSIGSRHQTNGASNRVNGSNGHADETHNQIELDALIVGAGFAGVYLLHRLRQEGYNVKIAEAGTGLGGIWHWNSYPGARVDSQYPVYAYGIPEVYNTWTWEHQYPGELELKNYFKHVDKVLDISRDVLYEHKVVSAGFDPSIDKWHLVCENGTRITARFFLGCLGFAAKRYFPDWPGLDDFKGYIAQEAAREAGHLTCFVRTPNLCIPMRQGPVDPDTAKKDLETLHRKLNADRYDNIAGFLYANPTKGVFDDPPDVRAAVLEEAWRLGGFRLLFSYMDIITDQAANDVVYDFWAKKRRAQMTDPEKRDILAPEKQPHAFGGKRPSLEQNYYEQMDKPHVKIVPVKHNPISRVTEKGIVTEDGTLHEVDIIALATGFDSVTGGLKDIELTGLNGESPTSRTCKHVDRVIKLFQGRRLTQLKSMFTYGPQSPTAYANGPSIVEKQDEWIVAVLNKMRAEGKTRLNANEDAEQEWKKTINTLHGMSLRDKVDGWYMGTNIPGSYSCKPREALNYAGGMPLYLKTINEVIEQDFKGFTVT